MSTNVNVLPVVCKCHHEKAMSRVATQTNNYKGLVQFFYKSIDYAHIIVHISLIMFQILWIQEFQKRSRREATERTREES